MNQSHSQSLFNCGPVCDGGPAGKDLGGNNGPKDSLSCENCNSHASRRVPLERQETGDSRRSTLDVGEYWVQESCQGGVVQYCSRATTPSQRNQGALEGQDLYDSMKRTMEKKLRENRQSYLDPFWKPLCKHCQRHNGPRN